MCVRASEYSYFTWITLDLYLWNDDNDDYDDDDDDFNVLQTVFFIISDWVSENFSFP
jgi:hypothetical protein